MISVTHREYRLYSPRVLPTTTACGQSRIAVFIGIALCIPNFLASYEHAATTPDEP